MEENNRKEVFDIKMKSTVVFFLCFIATLFLLTQSDLAARPEVGIPRWFGLIIDSNVVVSIIKVLALNTILFMGEIF